jgi:hypothetical protein
VAGQVARQSPGARLDVILGSGSDLPVLALAVALAAWALARRWWGVLPPAAWLAASLLLLLLQQPLFAHHLALLMPPAALTIAVALAAALAERTTAAPAARLSEREALASGATVAALFVVMLGLGIGLNSARHAAGARNHALGPAFVLAAATTPDDLVITDEQYVAGLADRDVPPNLVDTSNVRVQAGYLSAAQLEAAASSSQVRAVLFYSGRLDRVPGFRAWVAANFVLVRSFGTGQALYLKLPHGGPLPV